MTATPSRMARGRRWLTLATGVLALLVALDTLVWWVVTGRIAASIPGFVTLAAQQGWQVEAGTVHRRGWPWAATVRLEPVSATAGAPGLRWRVQALDLTIAPDDPRALSITPRGQQTIEAPGLPPLSLRAGTAVLRVPLDGSMPVRLDAAGLVLSRAGHAGRDPGEIIVARLVARFAGSVTSGTADAVRLTRPLRPPFDGPATLSWRSVLTRPLPTRETAAASAAAWQKAGGRVELPELTLAWGPLSIQAQATGGLDGALQPEGRADLRVQGGDALLTALAEAGLIPKAPATAAKAVLNILALAAPGAPIPLQLMLQDRVASLAGFPLLKLPMLTWSQHGLHD